MYMEGVSVGKKAIKKKKKNLNFWAPPSHEGLFDSCESEKRYGSFNAKVLVGNKGNNDDIKKEGEKYTKNVFLKGNKGQKLFLLYVYRIWLSLNQKRKK